jgi:chloride channel 7
MTMSLTIILLETTQSVDYLLPIMLTLILSKHVGDAFNISLYDLHLGLKCMPFVEPTAHPGFENFGAGAVASHPAVTLRARETGEQIVKTLETNTHSGFPVCGANGELVGFVLRTRLITLLKADALGTDGRLPLAAFQRDFDRHDRSIAGADVGMERLATEYDVSFYADESPLSVPVNYPLSKVHVLFRSLGLRHLCVVRHDNSLHGVITRKDLLITTFNHERSAKVQSIRDRIASSGDAAPGKTESGTAHPSTEAAEHAGKEPSLSAAAETASI